MAVLELLVTTKQIGSPARIVSPFLLDVNWLNSMQYISRSSTLPFGSMSTGLISFKDVGMSQKFSLSAKQPAVKPNSCTCFEI